MFSKICFLKSIIVSGLVLIFSQPALKADSLSDCKKIIQSEVMTKIFDGYDYENTAQEISAIRSLPEIQQQMIASGILAFSFADEVSASMTWEDILKIPDGDGGFLAVYKINNYKELYLVKLDRGDNPMAALFSVNSIDINLPTKLVNINLVGLLKDGDQMLCLKQFLKRGLKVSVQLY